MQIFNKIQQQKIDYIRNRLTECRRRCAYLPHITSKIDPVLELMSGDLEHSTCDQIDDVYLCFERIDILIQQRSVVIIEDPAAQFQFQPCVSKLFQVLKALEKTSASDRMRVLRMLQGASPSRISCMPAHDKPIPSRRASLVRGIRSPPLPLYPGTDPSGVALKPVAGSFPSSLAPQCDASSPLPMCPLDLPL